MKDFIPKGTGNSRWMKSSIPTGTTWEEALAMLRAGTFPFDLNGINSAGVAQMGDALNKANLLPDAVAALFGLGSDAVPSIIFGYLGKYAQHWWRQLAYTQPSYSLQSLENVLAVPNQTLQYSDSVTVADDGTVSLVNPTSVSPATLAQHNSQYSNKFYSGTMYDASYANDTGHPVAIAFIPDISKFSYTSSWGKYTCNTGAKRVIGTKGSIGEFLSYVQASNADQYPNGGGSGNYWYEYIGVPLDIPIGSPKIVTESYVGNGKYGEGNENSLSFDSRVVAVFMLGVKSSSGASPILGSLYGEPAFYHVMSSPLLTTEFVDGVGFQGVSNGSENYGKISPDGKTISWYTDYSADKQFNVSGRTYHVLAILI